ncbi:MAG: hypothetical protein HFH94_12255 [Lachnospiraceae bacterium]|jgi:uncharacterized membrane protein HdeD (DUF308 family)|nr:DUF308 domain-containing protein [uncultured Acetatifactor sp.]MCI9220490.1 hypothetical protein [Lachnospiraceae bacterium]
MKKLLKQIKLETLLSSALYIVLGIVALVIPGTMVKTMGYLIGILLIVGGAVSMICYLLREASQNYYRNDFGYGLVSIAVGILFLYKVEWIISLVPLILGILVVASGCRKLQNVIDMKRMGYGNWVYMLILAAVNVVLGAALIVNSLDAALFFLQLVGAGLIFSGVTDCITCFYLAKKAKGYFDDLNAVDSTFAEVVDADEDGQKG